MEQLAFILMLWGEPVTGMVAPSPALCEELVATALDDIWIAHQRHPYGIAVNGAIARAGDWNAECRPASQAPEARQAEWRS